MALSSYSLPITVFFSTFDMTYVNHPQLRVAITSYHYQQVSEDM